MNVLDSAIAFVSPTRALRRARARVVLERLRTYEAAGGGRRTANWRSSSSSVNVTVGRGLDKLRARSRDLTENNEFAGAALDTWTSALVGTGIRPTARVRASSGESDERSEAVRDLWQGWGETTACDFLGEHNFYGLQRIAQREVVEAGEVLFRQRAAPRSAGLPVPVQLQMLEADHLDTQREAIDLAGANAGGFIIQGVEFDRDGRRVAYHLFPSHPGEERRGSLRHVSERIPAAEVLHVFRTDRCGQARGVPWGASAMLDLKDFDSFTDAQLQRQLIASMFVGFVHDIEGGGLGDVPGKAADNPLDLEPGTWESLPTGRTITFSDPPKVEGFADFSRVTLRQIAKGYGCTYEDLSGDLSNVNFSTARLGRLWFNGLVEEWRELGFLVKLLDPVWGWFMRGALLAGVVDEVLPATWTAPPPKLVDPKTEIETTATEVRSGFRSLSSGIRRTGQEPAVVLEELAEDYVTLDRLGLTLDTDARNAAPGSPGAAAGGGGAEDGTPADEPEEPDAGPVDPGLDTPAQRRRLNGATR